uniref:NADH-ubiquinone oxidoreductase chain 3 n=1 Tax=Singhiella simplex TaxID=1608328 RepID=A0A7G2CUV2_9HEMI|nr:NADH dehydrogenase subunit 3 [Singhiella simplex]
MTLLNIIMIELIVLVLMLCFTIVSMKLKYAREKYSTFECGMELMSRLRLPFSLHFYFISIIFLIFDVEVMLIIPFIFCVKFYKIKASLISIMTLILVLILGFCYEWWTGLLSWML